MSGSGRGDLEFSYTDAERQALAEAVPDPDWIDDHGDWERLVQFAHYDEFRADKASYVSRELERRGRECLKEEAAFRSAEEYVKEIRIIARAARNLRKRLARSTPHGTDFARAFLGKGLLIDDKGDYIPNLYRDEVFLGLLGEVISNEEAVAEHIAALHANDVFAGRHHPAFARFVGAAIIFWQLWTNKPAGASHQVGPAGRFLCAAVNPLLTFAEQRGLRLRRGGHLTESVAGRLIEEIRRLDPPLNDDGTKTDQ